VNVVLADIQFFQSAEFQTLEKIAIVHSWRMQKNRSFSVSPGILSY